MVRMADFFKKARGEKVKKEEEKPPEPGVSLAKIAREKEPEERPEAIYEEALSLIERILKEAEEGRIKSHQDIPPLIGKMINSLSKGNNGLVLLASERATEENYLYAHSVNVSILSIKVGLGLGYERNKLIELGIAAFLHDVGMVRVMEIAQRPRRLTKEEYEEIKKHPKYGKEILEKIREISKSAVETAYRQHERLRGQGYPEGVNKEEVGEYAQIVGLADVYEALTHPRVYRKKMTPHKALEIIIDYSEDLFAPQMVKTLVAQISFYPIGSWVRLNTGEVGKIIGANKESPSRPIVNIIFSIDGERLKEAKRLNLLQHHYINIKEALNEEELEEK